MFCFLSQTLIKMAQKTSLSRGKDICMPRDAPVLYLHHYRKKKTVVIMYVVAEF